MLLFWLLGFPGLWDKSCVTKTKLFSSVISGNFGSLKSILKFAPQTTRVVGVLPFTKGLVDEILQVRIQDIQ